MEIKDYLHLYLGCECKGNDGSMIYTLGSVDFTGKYSPELYDSFGNRCNRCVGIDFKLILRPLSDMTGQEKKEYAGLFSGMDSINILPEIRAGRLINYFMNKKDPHQVVWLLSRGFDLFGLIDAGLAIDKTKIKK